MMIYRPKHLWIGASLFLLAANLIIVFVLIPEATSRMRWFYNGNQYADGYDQLATNLVQGNGYRFYPETAQTLLREPGYPILLAGIFTVFGKSFVAVKLINVVLALVVGYLITRIARMLSSSTLVILGAPLLFLFHPETLVSESRGGVEILFSFLLTLYVLTVYRAVKSNRWSDFLVSGMVLGLAVLVRSTPLLFPLILVGYLLLSERKNQRVSILRNSAVMVMAMFVVLSPWIIRNYLLTSKFVPTASVLGVAAHTGLFLSTHHAIGNVVVDSQAASERNELAYELGYRFKAGYYQYFYSSADEVGFSHYLLKRVVDEYRRSPLLFIRTVASNLLNFWCGGKTWESVAMNAIVQLPFVAMSIVGIVLSVKNDQGKDIAPLVLMIIYIVAVSVPILAQARYSQPLIPFLSILACITLVTAQKRHTVVRCASQETAFPLYQGDSHSPDAGVELGEVRIHKKTGISE